MNNKVLLIAIVLTPITLLQAGYSNAATRWEDSHGKYCQDVCSSKGSRAVSHGSHAGDVNQPMFVCATRTRDERPGLNVQPWPGKCIYAYGEKKSEESANYYCLCSN